MDVTGRVNNPELVELTLTVTMRVQEWEGIAATLGRTPSWPESDLVRAIQSAVRQLSRNVRGEPDEVPA